MNKNWTRWISTSIYKHYDDRRDGIELYLEGTPRPKTQSVNRFELRIDGPAIAMITSGYFELFVEINLLVQTSKTETDPYKQVKNTGIGQIAFTAAIPIYKYGNGVDDNRTIQLGCLQLDSEIITTPFLATPEGLLYTTIEGTYKMYLEEQ